MRGSRRGGAKRAPPSHFPSPVSRRASDVSSLSSSSLLPPPDPASLLRSVNAYLSPTLVLHPPYPSSRDLTLALRLVLSRLHFPSPILPSLDSLPPLLSSLRCPFHLSKSALRAPNSPHAFPSLLSVLHWLVHLALVSDHLSSSPSPPPPSDLDINSYVAQSYRLFLAGHDSAVADLESYFLHKIKLDAETLKSEVEFHEAKLRELKGRPTRLEALEAERAMLTEDARKFGAVVEKYAGMVEERRGRVRERERELEEIERERGRVEEENEGLRRRIGGQEVSVRDVERMGMELGIVERDLKEWEGRRDEMEKRGMVMGSELERRFREIEMLAERGNAAIRKYVFVFVFVFVLFWLVLVDC